MVNYYVICLMLVWHARSAMEHLGLLWVLFLAVCLSTELRVSWPLVRLCFSGEEEGAAKMTTFFFLLLPPTDCCCSCLVEGGDVRASGFHFRGDKP